MMLWKKKSYKDSKQVSGHMNEWAWCVPIKPYLEKWVAGQILTYKFWFVYFSSKQFCEVDNNDIIINLKDKEA